MSTRVRKNCDILKVLAKCNPRIPRAVIQTADKDLLESITECLANAWCETIKLSKLQRNLLRIRIIFNLLLINGIPSPEERTLFYTTLKVFTFSARPCTGTNSMFSD